MADPFLHFSPHITCLPVIHGSGDFALEVRRLMLAKKFDCVAVPLPPSFKRDVERAVELLPAITMVAQPQPRDFSTSGDDDDDAPAVSFVPIDPCQPVIAAIRGAIQQRIPRAYIDLEVDRFLPYSGTFPDAYALKQVSPAKFAAALLPAIPRPEALQPKQRIARMARRLRELERKHRSILFVCSLLDWVWVREAYKEGAADEIAEAEDAEVETTQIYQPAEKTLLFLLGELPFVTGLYERARAELEDDENLSVDGVKELLITARERYKKDLKKQARPITPQLLSLYLKYVRNLSLMERRLTPDLYTLVMAAQQFAGDAFAVHVAEAARDYGFNRPTEFPSISLGIDRARLPDGETVQTLNRLGGPPLTWRSLELRRRPDRKEQRLWQMRWNPYSQCSWPPEDVAIERFRTHAFERAKQLLNQDLARSEKFTTSVMDGIDVRETLRNWHTGDIFVKNFPPSRGSLDTAVMLFDSPADPRDYPYRVTWHAEHAEESTLAFFATDYRKNMVGPGIGQCTYGGAMMVFPPRYVPEIWNDSRFDAADTLEERLLMAACAYSHERHIALLSPGPPGAAWRRLAKHYGKKLIHLPLNGFSAATVQQLRIVHVLNGKQIRSFAADFIRKA